MKKMHSPKFLKNGCTLKALMKTINGSYHNIVNVFKNELSKVLTPFQLKYTCAEFVYD